MFKVPHHQLYTEMITNGISFSSTSSTNAFVEQNVSMISVTSEFLCRSKERLDTGLINHLDILIIKEQPVIMALDQANIVTMVCSASNMDDYCKKGVLRFGAIHCVQFQLHGEYNPI